MGSRQFDLFRKQQISIPSQEMEDVISSTGNETHQFLKACRQCTLLACTHLNVLGQHTEKENCHIRQTVCTLQSHRSGTYVFDQSCESAVCAGQSSQQRDGAGAVQQERLDQLA